MGKCYVGTSGWSYDHWKGPFYPKTLRSKDYFDYYVDHFDCVELNTSFYRLPKKQVVTKWKRTAPADFKFCPKLSRYITHQKKLGDCEQPLKDFVEVFKNLRQQMGPILVQLPQIVKFGNPHIEEFFKLLRRYRSLEFAIEARDESWMTDEAAAFLKEKGMAWVIADWGNGYPAREAVTSDTVYLRLHGPGKEYDSNYSVRQLAAYAKKAKKWMSQGKDVWAFFNNDGRGFAAKNALKFKEMV